MKNAQLLFRVLITLVSLMGIAGTAFALPAQTAVPMTGEIEAITLTTPGNVWSGGTMTVGGQVIILPANLLINLPNDYQTLQQLFVNAPPACLALGESGLAKGDRCNERATGAQATILANRTDSGNVIAGQVDIFKALESVTGTITYINYTDGYFRVNGNAPGDSTTGVMVRVNDPPVGNPALGRHTVQSGLGCAVGNTVNCSPDVRFKVDPDNYTFAYITGYPACIPTTANGQNDPNCPATNRPAIADITSNNPPAAPPVAADSRHFAPLKLGDSVKADGSFEMVNGVTFLSASSVRDFVDLTTRTVQNNGQNDPTQPDYLIILEAGWDGPAYPAGRVRGRFLTNASYHATDIDYFSVHYDPVNNAPHEQILYTTQGNRQQGQVVFNVPTGVFDSQIRMDFFSGAKVLDNDPCMALVQGATTTPKNFTAVPVVPGVNLASYCTSTPGTAQDFRDNFNLMAPVFREVMARSTRQRVVTGVALDIHGRPTQSGQYKLPTTIAYGAFEDINLGMSAFPHQFSGTPWLMDRRLSPNGCVGACEGAQQPLTPFPFEGVDPTTLVTVFGPAVPAASFLPTPDRMFRFMDAAGNFTGLLTWPPTNAPSLPILPTPALSLFPPFADEDAASTKAGVPVIIDVTANDIALIGTLNLASVKIATAPATGTTQVNPNGTITYTPAPNATGNISFTYTVANNYGSVSLPGTVIVSIVAAPVAGNDSATVAAKGSLAINVAGNDTPGSGLLNLASIVITTAPSCGTLLNQNDGVILFNAPAAVPGGGICTFRYTISDASVPALISNIATVTVTITPPEAPVAASDSATTSTGSSVVINVLANDISAASPINPATVTVSAPSGGTATANTNGTVTYTPSAVGIYTFTYTVKNSSVPPTVSNPATVTVTVTQGPVAVNDTATATTGTVKVISVLTNDTATAPATLNPASLTVTTPTGGTAAANSNGTINYTPPGTPGTYSFSYTVKDSSVPPALSNAATVTVTVSASPAVPTGTAVINAGATLTKTTSVTLTLTATSPNGPVTQMQFNKDGGAFSALETFAATRAVTLPTGDGPHTIGVRVSDSAGKLSATIPATITLDTTPPTGTLSINGGAALTGSALVNLAMTASDLNGVSSMQFSNDGINFFTPVPMAAGATLNLLPGDGLRTMLVRYIDAAGNVSAPVSNSITVSTVPPTGSIQIAGAPLTKNSTLTLNLSATSALSTVTQMQLSKDGGATYSALESYVPTRVLLPLPDGLQTIAVRFKDALGNLSQPYTASITIDSTGPTGSIVINSGATVTNAAPPTVTLTAVDPAGVSQMQFSKDGGATWSPLEPFASPKLLLPLSTPDGVKTIGVRYTDTLGNLSPMFSSSIMLDTTGPSGSILINGGAATTTSTTVTLTLSASDPAGVTQMQFSKDGAPFSAPEPYLTTRTLLPFASTGLHTVDVKFLDALGNVSPSFQASITIL
jgi:hypothetical protein